MKSVGNYTYGATNISILDWGESAGVYIGKFCSISSNVVILTGGNHKTERVTTYPFGHLNKNIFNKVNGTACRGNGDVIIGNDVWIGENVTIMSGITIGDGSVIARNSHVVKNVEPYSIVGGNPAKLIKLRFTPEQITELLKIKWWDWPDSDINNATPLLCSSDIQQFIDYSNTNLGTICIASSS